MFCSWLRLLLERLAHDTGAFGAAHEQPNHVLLNAYLPGQGIMPHQDGPLYHPGVCIVSLGAPAIMRFTRKHCDGVGAPLMVGEQAACQTPWCMLLICMRWQQRVLGAMQIAPSTKPVLSVALMPRSLLVFSGEAYENCLHGIDEARLLLHIWLA